MGGSDAAFGTHPWHVAIIKESFLSKRIACGGALISKRWVITAPRIAYTGDIDLSSTKLPPWSARDGSSPRHILITQGRIAFTREDSVHKGG